MTGQERLRVISKALKHLGESYQLLLTVVTDREETRLTSRFEHLEKLIADELAARVQRDWLAEKEAERARCLEIYS